MVPQRLRSNLRKSSAVNFLLRQYYGGDKSAPHPQAPGKRIWFDGYRNLGWNFGSLAESEVEQFAFATTYLNKLNPRCVWDIGANVGWWSLFFASFQPPIELIICFEPDAANRRFLEMNRDKNNITSMVIRDVGLSDKAGNAVFFADTLTGATGSFESDQNFIGKYYGATPQQVSIPVSTVDAEIASGIQPPQFMKIDVEGHELAVLHGAENLLRVHRPVMIMEVTRRENEITRFLQDHRYRLVDPSNLQPIPTARYATGAIPEELF
ncbi:MAG TPA: FkbM family methyltransferase [Tepidisphaeraceae bacterium]|nr:FkbM family methyltransferase [Tepidisphaeraceae bacterium]